MNARAGAAILEDRSGKACTYCREKPRFCQANRKIISSSISPLKSRQHERVPAPNVQEFLSTRSIPPANRWVSITNGDKEASAWAKAEPMKTPIVCSEAAYDRSGRNIPDRNREPGSTKTDGCQHLPI